MTIQEYTCFYLFKIRLCHKIVLVRVVLTRKTATELTLAKA